MKLESTRFGVLEINEGEIFSFPLGLIGLLHEDGFVFLQQGDQGPFIWLQSVKNPDLAFVVTDPWIFAKEYNFTLKARERSLLDLDSRTQPYILVTVNLSSPHEISLNLKGPLLFNREKRKGIQMVLEGDYPLRYTIPLAVLEHV